MRVRREPNSFFARRTSRIDQSRSTRHAGQRRIARPAAGVPRNYPLQQSQAEPLSSKQPKNSASARHIPTLCSEFGAWSYS